MALREVEHLGSLRYLPLVGDADQVNALGAVQAMFQAVMMVDDVIFRYAQALEAVQPPAAGKISIRFLRRQWGETDSRHPTFVQWFQGSSGRWLYNRLKPSDVLRRLKSYHAFMLTRSDARELLIQARRLVDIHENLIADLGRTRRALAMHAVKARKAVEPYSSTIKDWLPKIEARRAEIILGVREAKQFAVDELPDGEVADRLTIPRTHPKGRTRGTRTLTKPMTRG